MIKKFAVFVEGETELEFSTALLISLAGAVGIKLNIFEQFKGQLVFLNAINNNVGQISIEVLIVNCHNDERVKTEINNQYDGLVAQGYSSVIGLRDVYPKIHSDIPNLQQELHTGIKSGIIPIRLHLAIMEIEAGFLEEITHFEKIEPTMTSNWLLANGFDYVNSCAESIHHPANELDSIYAKVRKRYNKTSKHRKRTINSLDFNILLSIVRTKSTSLNDFITSIEKGFAGM